MMAVQPVVTETNFNRVFIVDDDDLFRESLGLNLAEEGYEVVDFANGESALEFMMSGEEAEAVLLDWRMPGLDGLARESVGSGKSGAGGVVLGGGRIITKK